MTRYTIPRDQVHHPPRTRYIPPDQVHPPRPGTPLGLDAPSPLWDQVPPRARYTPLGPGTPPWGPGAPSWTRHTPGIRYTPLWDQVHPPLGPGTPPTGTRYTPLAPGKHTPPPWTRYTPPPEQTSLPQSMLGDTVNARAVCILLECNLVASIGWCLISSLTLPSSNVVAFTLNANQRQR